MNKFVIVTNVLFVELEQPILGPKLNTCYVVAFELDDLNSFTFATQLLRLLQEQLYCIKVPALLVAIENHSNCAVSCRMIHELVASCGHIPFVTVAAGSQVPQSYLDIIGVWAVKYSAYSHALAFPDYRDNFYLQHSPKFLHCDIPAKVRKDTALCEIS